MPEKKLAPKPLHHRSLVEHIVESLENEIIEGRLKPGQRIVEAALCEAWGVSRSPLREAFRILESQGFLVRQARKGMFVAAITSREAEEILQIRASLESLAIGLVIRNGGPETIKRLKELHEGMVRAAEENKPTPYHRLNIQFHEVLLKACGNNHLVQLIGTLEKQIKLYRVELLMARGLKNSSDAHARIIELLESGDIEMAERERRERILSSIPLLEKSETLERE